MERYRLRRAFEIFDIKSRLNLNCKINETLERYPFGYIAQSVERVILGTRARQHLRWTLSKRFANRATRLDSSVTRHPAALPYPLCFESERHHRREIQSLAD